MSRRFIFPHSNERVRAAAPAVHASGFGIVASETKTDPKLPLSKTQIAEMAKTIAADVTDARDWLKRIGADEAVAMFDASVK